MSISPLNVSTLCPDVARAFEFSQNISFDSAINSLKPIIRELLHAGDGADTIIAVSRLRTSQIYVWLQQKMPQLKLADAKNHRDEAILVFALLAYLIAGSNDSPKKDEGHLSERPDRKRKTAAKALAKVKGYLNDGTIELPLEKASQLWALLTDASNALLMSRKYRTVDHPGLLMLARVLVLYGFADYHLLLEIANLAEIECDDSTAARYIATAKDS